MKPAFLNISFVRRRTTELRFLIIENNVGQRTFSLPDPFR